MLALLKSRKFKLTLTACLVAVVAALKDEVSWEKAVLTCVVAIVANVLGIAAEDSAAKFGSWTEDK